MHPDAPQLAAAFSDAYGRPPEVVARAPGRVDLMGSHTDYNLGSVLTMAIDRSTWVAVAPSEKFRAQSLNDVPDERWQRYLVGVAAVFRRAGYDAPPCDVLVWSDVPMASGLSSSAALECSFAVALEALGGHAISRLELARMCQQAENEFAGVRCGILDQYTSLNAEPGSSILLDCAASTHRAVPIDPSIQPVICDTRAPRRLASSEYSERRASCEEAARFFGCEALCAVPRERFESEGSGLPREVRKRARFILEEHARVCSLARALADGDRAGVRESTAASYAGARELFEITVPEMDALMMKMLAAPGAIGARQAGAGFGGCMLALVESACLDAFLSAVPDSYAVSPSAGARVVPG